MQKIRKEWLEEMLRNGRAYPHEVKAMAAMLLDKWVPDPEEETKIEHNADVTVLKVPASLLVRGPLKGRVGDTMGKIKPGVTEFVEVDWFGGPTAGYIVYRVS